MRVSRHYSSKFTNAPVNRISVHWPWLLGVIIIILAIVLGWILACFFRRRYLAKKEREFELRPPAAPWVNGQGANAGVGPGPYPRTNDGVKGKGKEGMAMGGVVRPGTPPRSSGALREKWVVKERT
jgi:hypothetical protein